MRDGVTAWRLVLPGGLGPVDQDPDAVRQDACELLSPQVACDPPDFRPGTGGGAGGAGSSGLGVIAWVLLGLLVAALVGLAVRSFAGRVRDRRPDDEAAPDGDELQPLEHALVDADNPPADWRTRSQRHRAAGRYRDAIRCEYRALVGDLARRDLLDEIPGRTTGEERAQLRRTAPMVSEPFGAAADLFDTVWYGAADATEAMAEQFDRWEQEILAATARARRPVEVP